MDFQCSSMTRESCVKIKQSRLRHCSPLGFPSRRQPWFVFWGYQYLNHQTLDKTRQDKSHLQCQCRVLGGNLRFTVLAPEKKKPVFH